MGSFLSLLSPGRLAYANKKFFEKSIDDKSKMCYTVITLRVVADTKESSYV